jgi:hypothetical protein
VSDRALELRTIWAPAQEPEDPFAAWPSGQMCEMGFRWCKSVQLQAFKEKAVSYLVASLPKVSPRKIRQRVET